MSNLLDLTIKSVKEEFRGISIQTYIAKNLGHFENWEDRLMDAINSKYDIIHFTPLQKLGDSNSAYSICDQTKMNPIFTKSEDDPIDWENIKSFVNHIYEKYGILSTTDIILNHTSFDSSWIYEHPDSTYNLSNTPHLKPAYLLDRLISKINKDVSDNKYINRGLNNHITESKQLEIIREIFWEEINAYKLHEFYLAHIDNIVHQFREYVQSFGIENFNHDLRNVVPHIELINKNFERLKCSIDYNNCAIILSSLTQNLDKACEIFKIILSELNEKKYMEFQEHVSSACDSFIKIIEYRFLNPNGLKLKYVTSENLLDLNYFYHPFKDIFDLEECEKLMNSKGEKIMACNGCVKSEQPWKNFADEDSNAYLRREISICSDVVKLKYGHFYHNNPYLWDYMNEYVIKMASIFHGVILDNCNSIELNATKHFLNNARKINPDLFVMSELFVNSKSIEKYYSEELGIDVIIRNSCKATNAQEFVELMRLYGTTQKVGAIIIELYFPIQPVSIIYDRSHHNQSAILSRSLYDILPTAAALSMGCCAVGSNWGYDHMVPEKIDLINDNRLYPLSKLNDGGIVSARALLNDLHRNLERDHYKESAFYLVQENIISIERSRPDDESRVIMVCHHGFTQSNIHWPFNQPIKCITTPGNVVRVLFEMWTRVDIEKVNSYVKNETVINGLPGIWVEYQSDVEVKNSKSIQVSKVVGDNSEIEFKDFPQGSVVVIEVSLKEKQQLALERIKSHLKATKKQMKQLNKSELEILFLKTTFEEKEETGGKFEVYTLPDNGGLKYCGLIGFKDALSQTYSSLVSRICENLQQGNWAMDYCVDRLLYRQGNLKKFGNWLKLLFDDVKILPRYLIPKYFDIIIRKICEKYKSSEL